MNFSDLLADMRHLSEIKNRDLETNYQILLKNSQLVNHPGYINFVSEIIQNNSGGENKEILELFAKFGGNVDLKKLFYYDTYHINYVNGEVVFSRAFHFTNAKELRGPDWVWCLPASRIFCRSNINVRKDLLILLLKHGLDVMASSYHSKNILEQFVCYFVEKGDTDVQEIVEILINSGVPIKNYNDLLEEAICTKNVQLVSYFIKIGADINKRSKYFRIFPIHMAAAEDDVDIVNLLILNGAKVNARDGDQSTALHCACTVRNKQLITLLIQKGADVSIKNKQEETPFALLKKKNFLEDYLPDKGNHDQCVEIMVREIAKLSFNNFSVVQKDLDLIQASSKLQQYFETCIEELTQMSSSKFYYFYSYNDVLNMANNINKLASLTKNEEFVVSFEKNLSFSRYENNLQRIFDDAIQVRDKSEAVISRLYLAFGDVLPDLVIRKLEKNLTLEDLPPEVPSTKLAENQRLTPRLVFARFADRLDDLFWSAHKNLKNRFFKKV